MSTKAKSSAEKARERDGAQRNRAPLWTHETA